MIHTQGRERGEWALIEVFGIPYVIHTQRRERGEWALTEVLGIHYMIHTLQEASRERGTDKGRLYAYFTV